MKVHVQPITKASTIYLHGTSLAVTNKKPSVHPNFIINRMTESPSNTKPSGKTKHLKRPDVSGHCEKRIFGPFDHG
jgi:hypothetical protein